ncbi:DNA processing protein [Microbispora rosea]|uniref:DNA processing protein n=1 Tax=Microbispora rosea TaxID=58117 RepID=A0A1N7AIP6_9ACTN|nr:DNA-processing protein DprA [Microbispora rosea]GIH51919.1 putative DNA processing protein DprA [Microbispora rosea subsp. rosea]SIR39017.1 DNA processing protein [Microbispora rosea]
METTEFSTGGDAPARDAISQAAGTSTPIGDAEGANGEVGGATGDATGPGRADRLARVAIMRMAEAGDAVMSRLIARFGPVGAMEQARRGVLDPDFARDEKERAEASRRHLDLGRHAAAWAARYTDPACDLEQGMRRGARLVVPGDVEWPTQLDDLGQARPFGLWVDGQANLRFSCLRSVSVVGARAATAYGTTVAAEFAMSLGGRGWTVISGGAYGIDGAAHRGALASGTPTVVVLACGTDVCYPSAHEDLFGAVRRQGVVISEWPPGAHPTRLRFLIRNRVIAALSRGTVVVQAAARSGALNTATHAWGLNRQLMAVPGPITTEVSAGCHVLIRQGKAVCVTSAEEIVELVGSIGDDLAPEQRGPVRPRDGLNDETRRVLEAIPARGATGPAVIAVAAGVDIGTALACLGALAAAGFVENVDRGWRLRPAARE